MASVERLREFFFEGHLNGYAGVGTITAAAEQAGIPDLPGMKVVRYERPPLRFVDCWGSGKSVGTDSERTVKLTFGFTVIWEQQDGLWKPAWEMQYHGWWENSNARVIPFLKAALRTAYAAREFRGGRGPSHFYNAELMYRNRPWPKSSFADFHGHDEILLKERERCLFRHEYSGMLL